jgi:hypothetical protein
MNYDFDSLPDNSSALKKIIADLTSSLDQKNEEIAFSAKHFLVRNQRNSPLENLHNSPSLTCPKILLKNRKKKSPSLFLSIHAGKKAARSFRRICPG